jgi:hypothetical protein
VDDGEGRAADLGGIDPESLGETADKRRLPCSEVARQEQHVARLQFRSELARHIVRLAFGLRDELPG